VNNSTESEGLIRSETNFGGESKGVAYGLQGNLFLPVVFAALLSTMTMSGLVMMGSVSIPAAFGIAAIPFVATLLFVIVFLNDKPPHYLGDVWDSWLSDGCLSRYPAQPKHPIEQALSSRHGKDS